jgi:hypothetical protein
MILLSATYQQSSQDNPEAHRQTRKSIAVAYEPPAAGHRVAARFAPRSFRQLDLSAGGPPFSLTALPAAPRRTVYGYIERGRVPVFLSSFDFASPDQHVPIRYSTTVPQQALFLLNSTFVAEQARRLAERIETDTDGRRNRDAAAKRIQALYRSVFGRAATRMKLNLGERFVASPSHEEPPATPASAWQYGFGRIRCISRPHQIILRRSPTSMSPGRLPTLPDPIGGSARLRAAGGEPGADPQHAVIRRW